MPSKSGARALKSFAAFAAVLMLLAPSLALAGPLHPLSIKDMVMMDRVSDPHVSPDGRWAVYSLRVTNWEANKGVTSLWLVDLRTPGAVPRRLAASTGGAMAPQWSPDGRWIYFLSSRSGSDQVWRTGVDGSRAMPVTRLPLEVLAYRPSPDGSRLVVSMAVFPDCETPECTHAKFVALAAGKASGMLYDRLFIRHWDTWADGTRNHLFALRLSPGGQALDRPTPLMAGFDGDAPAKPFGDNHGFAFTPDGKTVIFSAKLAGKDEPWTTNFDLWRTPVDGSAAPVDLTAANKGADEGPVVSPDGTRLAWRAQPRAGFESDRSAVMLMDLATGQTRELDAGFDRSADQIAWSADGRTLYASAEDVGQVRLFGIDAASGEVRPLTGEGRVTDFDVGPAAVVFAHDAFDAPAQLFRQEGGGPAVQLTRHNDERLSKIAFGGYEQFAFKGWNGETVHGYVVKPADYQPGRRYPVAFLIHGGPQTSFGNMFNYRWNAESYVGQGFAVVMIDFHGSPGYGQAFTDSISRHWGDRPLEDLQKGWAAALAKYDFLDGDRACALGGSYGGYMINWIAGNWNGPWKCLVNHDGIFDNRMMGYSTEELWFSEWENGGTPWDHAEDYERFNPIDHVAAWSKPELVIHSDDDYRVPQEQGIATFTALQRRGIPSEMLRFPDENHWVLKPRNSVQWHDTVFAWLKKWTGAPAS